MNAESQNYFCHLLGDNLIKVFYDKTNEKNKLLITHKTIYHETYNHFFTNFISSSG